MKGILLAGGKGTRLFNNTRVVNKHLARVFTEPMLEYPLQLFKQLNVNDILIVTGKEHAGSIFSYLGSGKLYDMNFTYKIQDESGGIAEALGLAKDFVNNEKCIVALADNIFDLKDVDIDIIRCMCYDNTDTNRAYIFLKKVKDPQRFGVATVSNKIITSIEEKPLEPKSNLAVVGLYIYPSNVFDKIAKIKYSKRGEKEITTVNQLYIKEKELSYYIIQGFWSDAGTLDSIQVCDKYFSNKYESTRGK